ncbi:PH domain-containing protein [Candidatus Palauibacter soopunensis]|uniref:PH domain-containing protein n=1 Tax=Candidatus Palauibacter soopunensis TaxID=3056739 RepID=UPI0023835B20|nr:PH domain-containing protein [Candidatus Palauibacter soopunensis]MDE2879918.1 PH domain-containing protein [Candidatus Palauibacter soopunensis]
MPSEAAAPSRATEHRLHPLSIGFSLGSQLRRAILPLIIGGASANFLGVVEMRFVLLVGLIPLVVGSVVRYLTFRYRYEEAELVIRSGLLFRRERHVPYARIQNLDAVQGVFHRVLGVVEVKLQTGGGQEPEATLTVLPLPALEALRERVREGKREAAGEAAAAGEVTDAATGTGAGEAATGILAEPAATDLASAGTPEGRTLLHLPARELLLHGLLQNRGMVLIAAAFGLAWETGLFERASDWVAGEQSWIGPAVEGAAADVVAAGVLVTVAAIAALVVAFVIFARLLSIVWTLVRLHDYRVVRSEEGLRATFGMLTQVAATIPLRRVQTVTIHEGPLHRWAGRVAVGVQTAGGSQAGAQGNADPHRHQLAPILRRERLREFLREVIPELDAPEVNWEPVSPLAFRRVLRGTCFLATLAAVPLYFALEAWGVAFHAAFLAWAVLYARRYVDHLGWALKDDMVWFRSGWLWRRTTIARYTRIQVVALRASPIDRWRGMASLRVDTAGAGAASHKVDIPYLPVDTARELRTLLAAEAARTAFRW